MKRKLTFIGLMALLAGAVAIPLTASGERSRVIEYTGQGTVERQMRVELSVTSRQRASDFVTFDAERVPMTCETGPVRYPVGILRANLREGGVFESIRRAGGETPDNTQTLEWLKGRLIGERRAKGFVLYLSLPYHDGRPSPGRCSTVDRVHWKATRVR